jgi:signal transduction histidine kinase
VDSIAVVSSPLEAKEIIERMCEEAKRLFDAREARFLSPAENAAGESRLTENGMIVPLAVRGNQVGALSLIRPGGFHRWDLMRASVLADFASRAAENARLIVEAQEREGERTRLAEQLITAEQDERRRLSLYLHDGPVQSMAGIALMNDAALAALRDGRYEDAAKVIEGSLERERRTIQELRDLSFAIEPVVLRDQGFGAAVRALGDQVEQSHRITVATETDAGERLSEKAQVALYQIIRESLNQAVRRQPQQIGVTVVELDGGGFAAEIDDDGVGERRRASIEEIDERVRILNARLSVESRPEGGTAVRVVMPSYVAAADE